MPAQIGSVRILLDCGGRVDSASGHVLGVATPQHLFGLRKDKVYIDISSIDVILLSSYRSVCSMTNSFGGMSHFPFNIVLIAVVE